MLSRTLHPLVLLALFITVGAFAVSGCQKTDLSGYQKASRNHKAASEAVPDASTAIQSSSTETVNQEIPTSTSPVDDSTTVAIESLPVSAIFPANVVDGGDVRSLMNVVKQEASQPASDAASSPQAKQDAAQPIHVVELLVKERIFRKDKNTGGLSVSFDDLDLLKVLNMEPVTEDADKLMPDWLLALNGKKIRLRGFMFPPYETEGIERFTLARDNQICCFGRDPKVYDLVQIIMKPGTTANYIPAIRAFDVVGIFQINMVAEEGKPLGLYFIEQAEIIDR